MIVEMSYKAQEGHIASAFSIVEILCVLYKYVLEDDDRFILSKGHGSLALYAVLAQMKLLDKKELASFAEYDSILGGHPDRNKVPAILASTGSLGHGLPMAVGVAMALKAQKKPGRVYVLVGDGELNEGSCYEALLLALHHGLNNLCCIVDQNHSSDRALKYSNLTLLLSNFAGVFVSEGHDYSKLLEAFLPTEDVLPWDKQPVPSAVIALTTKGKGVSFMEDNPEWHHKSPNKEEYKLIMKELEEECENN